MPGAFRVLPRRAMYGGPSLEEHIGSICDDADEKYDYVNAKKYFARNTLHTLK